MVAASAFCLVAAAACGSLPQGPVASSPSGDAALNVRGTVDRAYTPWCPTDEPCDPPIGAFSTYVSFSRVSHPTVRVRAVDGAFALHLAPAIYRIAVTPALGTVSPATVRVPRIGVVRLHVVVQPTP